MATSNAAMSSLTKQDFFHRLDRHLTCAERRELAACREETLCAYHFGLGQWIRNTWINRGDGSLAAAFLGVVASEPFSGLCSPDALSMQVIIDYWHYLQTKKTAALSTDVP